MTCIAAELPKSGLDPPVLVTGGPIGLPDDPGAPIGSGLLVIAGLSVIYILKKKKEV